MPVIYYVLYVQCPFPDVVPVRFNLWLMLFTGCWMAYMLRVNMSLNLIAMVPQAAHNDTLVITSIYEYHQPPGPLVN